MSRKPDWDVCALNKLSDDRARIGAAWNNKDGSIGIVFNPFTTVPVSRDVIINLFPSRMEEKQLKPVTKSGPPWNEVKR